MQNLIQEIIGLFMLGTFLGAVYGVIALGLSLIFGVQNVINVAHGEFVMLGAFVAFFSWTFFSISPIIALALVFPILFVVGVLIQVSLIERIKNEPELTSLILTFGLSLMIMNLALAIFSPDYRQIGYLTSSVDILQTSVALNRPLTFVASVILLAALFGMLKYSAWGKAIRATSQNHQVAEACGIDTRKIRSVSFGIGIATAGFAGGLVAMIHTVYPAMGMNYLVIAFVIVVLGGLGSLHGAVVGGVIFGNIEMFGAYYLDQPTALSIAFLSLIVLLLVYPQGLFGSSDPVTGGAL